MASEYRSSNDRDDHRPNLQPQWLIWAQQLQAIAQTGQEFSQNVFDTERYKAIAGVASEIMANHSDLDSSRILENCLLEKGYATPKVDVRGVAFQDGKILLVKEKMDGLWTLPGGYADIGDSPSEAVEREVREESGYETKAVKLLAALDRAKHPHPPFPYYIYKLFIQCEITGGRATTSIETDEVGFFSEDSLPPLSLSRVLPEQIARMFEHARHPDWQTDFD